MYTSIILSFESRHGKASLSIRDSSARNVKPFPKLCVREISYTRRRSHTHARYYVSQTGAWRSYIRQERRALVATAVFHFALKPRAPRILLIRYIRKLIVIRWSRVYTREPPSLPSRRPLVHPPAHAQPRYMRTHPDIRTYLRYFETETAAEEISTSRAQSKRD